MPIPFTNFDGILLEGAYAYSRPRCDRPHTRQAPPSVLSGAEMHTECPPPPGDEGATAAQLTTDKPVQVLPRELQAVMTAFTTGINSCRSDISALRNDISVSLCAVDAKLARIETNVARVETDLHAFRNSQTAVNENVMQMLYDIRQGLGI
jgi:hypothetical protein